MLRIVGGLENAFLDFLVALLDVVLHFLRKSFQFLQIGLNGVRKICELERKKIGIRQTHDGGAAGLRERTTVYEIRVAEMRVPVEIVVNGMVNAAAVFAAEPDVQRGDAVVLQKSRVIGTGAESGDAQVDALANFLALLGSFGVGNFVELLALPGGEFCFRVGDFARDILAELFQRVRAFNAEIAAAIAVGIDVRDAVRAQFVVVLLGPFGRAEKAGLFAIPRAINNGAFRFPAGLDELTESPRFFHEGNLARNRILSAVHPPIVMIAADHPFIGKSCALNFSNHIVDGLDVPVRFHFEVNFSGAGADVIRHSKAAAPSFRSDAASQCSEQRLRVGVGNWQHRDFGDRGSVFDFEALGVFGGSNSRRERITGIKWHVRNAAALDTIQGAIGAGGKSLSLSESVFMRVGIDEATDSAVLGGNLGLDAAPGMVVAGNDNFSLYGNTHALKLLVVFGDSVVDVDEGSGDVAVDGVGVVGGKLLGLLT